MGREESSLRDLQILEAGEPDLFRPEAACGKEGY